MQLFIIILLSIYFHIAQAEAPLIFCNISKGMDLINRENISVPQITSILKDCDTLQPNDPKVLLLHGLFERKQALQTKNYIPALMWLSRAWQAAPTDISIALELATTYEWENNLIQAAQTYQAILNQNPQNHTALLGLARILRLQNQFDKANTIYQQLLNTNPMDVDALNGLGWVAISQKNLTAATNYFSKTLTIQSFNLEARTTLTKLLNGEGWSEFAKNNLPASTEFFKKSLTIEPDNAEAKQGLEKIAKALAPPVIASVIPSPVISTPVISLCEAEQGMILLNQKNPPLNQIHTILTRCDNNTPNSTETLMLHGLLARFSASQTKNYELAITWFKRAMETAEPNNDMPALELAVTYEWAQQPKSALSIYQYILQRKPNNHGALSGKARVFRQLFEIQPSLAIYQQMLKNNPNDIEALNGIGETLLTNYELEPARSAFNKALVLSPGNTQLINNLELLNKTTKNMLSITGGHYTVPPRTSDGLNLYYFRNLNATDGLTILAVHNTKQIESGFGAGPTLLPNNSLLLGYQRIIPRKYGWQVSYDAREHKDLPFESRAYGGVNLFLNQNVEWFGGFKWGFAYPWNTQLIISGVTAYTNLPANVTVTGFWSFQQIGGYNSSYSLDFSKEYADRLFYDVGPSYLPEQKSWEVHGRLILPTYTNQAFVAEFSHYFFNRSTFITAGWRFYWA